MVQQKQLDGGSYTVRSEPAVPYRTDREGYETFRHQYRDTQGNKREETFRVHNLVAIAHFGTEPFCNGAIVHHLNSIPWDNRESNISLMTLSGHSKHHNRSTDHSSKTQQ